MTPDEERELRDMKFEAIVWKQIAAYLAEVNIATAETLVPMKSTSKYEKNRLRNVVETCHRLLTGMEMPKFYSSTLEYAKEKVDRAAKRAKDFMESFKE
jgi:hypothetical protein